MKIVRNMVIICGWLPIILLFAHFNMLGFSFGQQEGLTFQSEPEAKPELKCLVFNDGKTAVITVSYWTGGYQTGTDSKNCNGHAQTVAWFIKHGYHIEAVSVLEIYMTR